MFETLFGLPLAARFIIAFIVVLALIGAAAWLVRRFAANRLGGGGLRGRQPRLAVIEAANVDTRRRLLLIRRDNTEHLLMIGGPTDIVIEPNIVRAPAAREPARTDNGARTSQEAGWPLQPIGEPVGRARAGEESWPPEVPARPRGAETHSGLGAAHAARFSAPELAPASAKPEPRISAPSLDSTADQNLADMANQLEAALRRESPKPSESPRPPREIKMRIDPRIEARNEPKLDVKPEPKLDIRPKPEPRPELKPLFTPEPKREPKLDVKPEPLAPKTEAKPDTKPEPKSDTLSRQDFYDNLEEEMASLLGRPAGKS